ncbi:ABC-type branched-chain amino acid transport system, substrate-binding protein [Monaibacterium marinum]|uniref:ABC-type branched-chain amino acid transport system, substrate-binding protein n=1 Tax=Pontivivens marinum TaxID=1690039 RepID=A0A2C9CNZ4_9RHOB|nr:penicillin-binding protein activator [Monaibacterium marinum]SOH92920.1 ABC-type branched-chain amino acid transport system, substrate-binding protein [Monaibacterium marinum]
MSVLSQLPARLARTAGATLLGLAALTACAPTVATGPTTPVEPAEPVIPQPGEIAMTGPVRVALLVPTGSGDADRNALGNALERAARLALTDRPGSSIELTVLSTGGDPTMAATAATQAVAMDADLIVGPLFSGSVSAVGPIAQQAGIPVLSFSNNAAVGGDNVYVLGRTFGTSARRLVSFAAAQGLRNTGLIHTQDAEGRAALAAVQTAATESGAQLVAVASYPRSREGIPAAAEFFTNQMLRAGVDNLLLSDRGTGLIYAASFLPFHGMNVTTTQIMGLQELTGGAISAERALEGAWYTVIDESAVAAFNNRYASQYGSAPHSLASLAYDGIAAADTLVADARASQNPRAFDASNLTRSAGFTGAEGTFRFRPDGGTDRALAIMEVTRDGPQLVDPAPGARTFAGL